MFVAMLERIWPAKGKHHRRAVAATTAVLVTVSVTIQDPTALAVSIAVPVFYTAREAYIARRAARHAR